MNKKISENISFLLKSGVIVSAGVLLMTIISCIFSKNSDEKFKNFELVEAVAVEDVINQLEDVDGKFVLNSYLPVDIDNDGKSDFDVQLVVDKKSTLSLEDFKLLEIRKGDELILEGDVERDVFGNIQKMKSYGNGIDVVEGHVFTDKKRGANYMNGDNIISVNEEVINMPRKNDNTYILSDLLNQKLR
ncbi:MAG: hypothetical protein ACI4N3_02400 [Alphaproteobacteria bacterium]